jgi:hypothetical protein
VISSYEKGLTMLRETVRALCLAAGWDEPEDAAGGEYAFHLEGELDFTLSSPDGARLLVSSVLLAPTVGQEISQKAIEDVLTIAAGRFSRLRAIPALEPERNEIVLYDFMPLKNQDRIQEFVERFLNELAFWKAQPLLSAFAGTSFADAPEAAPSFSFRL